MRSSFTWNGISSESLGLFIEAVPNQNRPERKMDVYNVPGRSGDIVIMQDAWENVEQRYIIWGGMNKGDATTLGYAVSQWLFGASGYQVLSDTYDTDHYRLAYFAGGYDFTSHLQRQGRAEITFSCDPRRFLNSGATSISLPEGVETSLVNPTIFPAKPLITVTPNGATQGTVNNVHLETGGLIGWESSSPTGAFVLNSEKEAATWPSGLSQWSGSTYGNYIILGSGTNKLLPSGGGSTTYSIVPNWWEL